MEWFWPAFPSDRLPTELIGQPPGIRQFAACHIDTYFFKPVKQKKWFNLFHCPLTQVLNSPWSGGLSILFLVSHIVQTLTCSPNPRMYGSSLLVSSVSTLILTMAVAVKQVATGSLLQTGCHRHKAKHQVASNECWLHPGASNLGLKWTLQTLMALKDCSHC